MKNKHLVLLFVGTLALGLLSHRFHWFGSNAPDVDLLRLDTSAVTAFVLTMPDKPEITLNKTEEGWVLFQNNLSVIIPQGAVSKLFSALAPLKPLEVLTEQPADSLGLQPQKAIRLQVISGEKTETLLIGAKSRRANAVATFVELPLHGGRYLVVGDLGSSLKLDVKDFTSNDWCRFNPAEVRSLAVGYKNSVYRHWTYSDSLKIWTAQDTLKFDSAAMAVWLRQLTQLSKAELANFFDQSMAREHRVATIELEMDAGLLTLNLFYLRRPPVPDDITRLSGKPRAEPCYIVNSSTQPENWYALYDTFLARRILDHSPGGRPDQR